MESAAPGATVDVFAKMPNGEVVKIAETEADENGKYVAFSEDLEAGDLAIQIVTKDEAGEQKSGFKSVQIADATAPYEVKPIAPSEPIDMTEDKTLKISLAALEGGSADQKLQIIAHIQSTVFSQTPIADASNTGEFALNLPEALAPGEHTASLYAVDLETGDKTEAQQLAFTVTNTAFAGPQQIEDKNPIGIIAGSVIALVTLLGLGYFFRKPHHA